ncbi:MAG TPA: dihydroorotase, partial [Chromatiales bacterium]|nr:dihydroorotase [Chromatiales bacterium]
MTHERIHIHHGHIIDPASGVDAPGDLYIADGKIVSLNTAPDGFSADTEIDASNKIVCPGFIDLSARLREPGQEHKGTIASETRAAARSGITTLCCPPDTLPVIDTPAVADLIQNQARKAGYARVLPIGALTYRLQGDQLSEMAALKDAGCVGVGNALQPLLNTLVQRRSMEYAATHDLTVFLHSEDPSLRDAGTVHEGPVSARLGIPGIPEAAETVAVARDLALVACTGVRAHFCRLSTAHAIKMVARAQFDGLPVSAD